MSVPDRKYPKYLQCILVIFPALDYTVFGCVSLQEHYTTRSASNPLILKGQRHFLLYAKGLQIDTTKPDVLEAALRRYNGKPMVNSVNGKQEIMDSVFPIVKKYGGLLVALTIDEDGIPEDSARRVEIAKKIYKEAEKYGIKKSDIS